MEEKIVSEVRTATPIARKATAPKTEEPVFVSCCRAVTELLEKIDVIAKAQTPVFITGESGTGKEVIARLVHHKSGDPGRPLVAVNCAALPKDVIDNELFGHEREAFTGATSLKPGCFELADGGTLFLDEIAELHPQLQSKLLRAIETKSFRRLGGRDEVSVDVRVIAATNRDVTASLKSGALREDLYYRLSVFEIDLPPLRERREDIPALVRHFVTMFGASHGKPGRRCSEEAVRVLSAYDWPGNVRELKNVIESVLLLRSEEVIEPEMLPARITKHPPRATDIPVPVGASLADVERALIERTVEALGGNKSRAAEVLGVSRKTLYDKLARFAKVGRGKKA